ncbi:hypothetical protein JOH52_007210 [Sinorhizobium meliloti]|nr:hypothetical protein [Sinorhizobium meliloti]GEC41614.1 hypothetical protein EME01_56860 [Sinorhizobium meliloti]
MGIDADWAAVDPGMADNKSVTRNPAAVGAEMNAIMFDQRVNLGKAAGVNKLIDALH